MEKVGRYSLLSAGMLLASCCSLGFALDPSSQSVVLLFSSLFNTFSICGWNALDVISVDCFPPHLRSLAIGLFASCGRIASVCAQITFGYFLQRGEEGSSNNSGSSSNSAENANVGMVLFVMTGFMVAGGLSVWLLPNHRY